jgi:D-alanyl-D-alanine dipeptidase
MGMFKKIKTCPFFICILRRPAVADAFGKGRYALSAVGRQLLFHDDLDMSL